MKRSFNIYRFNRSEKDEKRKERKSLLKKLQSAKEKISNLENALMQAQNDAKSQSSKVCIYNFTSEILTHKELYIQLYSLTFIFFPIVMRSVICAKEIRKWKRGAGKSTE